MIQSFRYHGRLPGLNEMLKWARSRQGKWQQYDAQKRRIETALCYQIQAAKLKPMCEPVEIIYSWQEPNRKRDLDNICAGRKFINDALVKAGILQNDGWAQVRGFQDHFCLSAQPSVYITLKPWQP